MREDIISFIRDENRHFPFFLEMTGISYCDGTYKIARSNSPITVIEYVLQGKGTVTTDGKIFAATEGDVYLLHKGSSHCYFSDGADPWVKIWMNVGGPLADSLISEYGIAEVNHAPGLDLRGPLEEVLADARAWGGDADGLFQQAAVIFHRIVISIRNATKPEAKAGPPEAMELKSWIDRHIYDRTSIGEFAGHIYRSPSQAIRIFKRQFGVTPYDYLLNKRIETAKLLLQNTGLSVKEIAYRLNFVDEHYFSNYFKKKAGASPSYFRGNKEDMPRPQSK